eukprot:g26388.t1
MARLAVWVGALAVTAADGVSCGVVPCVQLPHSVQMPMIALGSWRGSYKDCAQDNYTCAQAHARGAVQTWLQELNGTHVDTATGRQEVFITTKCPGAIGFNATLQCIEDNLQMLGFYGESKPYIDLVLVHFPFAIKPECIGVDSPACTPSFYDPGAEARRDTWAAMEFALRSGRARAIGVSNYEVKHLVEIMDLEEKPAVNQVEWHPYHHDDELKLGDFQDVLKRGPRPEQRQRPPFQTDRSLVRRNASALLDPEASGSVMTEPLQEVAQKHNVSTAQVVLRWSLQQNVSVVVGTEKAEHMKTDLEVFSFQLSAAEMQSISKLKVSEVFESLQPWARPVRPALNFKCLNGMKPLVLSDDSECDLPHTARYTGADQKAHGSNASSAEVTTSGGTRGAAPSQLESDSDFEGLGFIPGLGDESEEEVTEVFAFNTWESHQTLGGRRCVVD